MLPMILNLEGKLFEGDDDGLPISVLAELPSLEKSFKELKSEYYQLVDSYEICNAKEKHLQHKVECLCVDMKNFDNRIQLLDSEFESVKTTSKDRLLEEWKYDGTRDEALLENFFWAMESCFHVYQIPPEEHVNEVSSLLVDEAKKWWQNKIDKAQIYTWESFKEMTRIQFLPCSNSWQAWEALKKKKHESSIMDYIDNYSSLMLQIGCMSDEDKLYNFIDGLKTDVQSKILRLKVEDFKSAIIPAKALALSETRM